MALLDDPNALPQELASAELDPAANAGEESDEYDVEDDGGEEVANEEEEEDDTQPNQGGLTALLLGDGAGANIEEEEEEEADDDDDDDDDDEYRDEEEESQPVSKSKKIVPAPAVIERSDSTSKKRGSDEVDGEGDDVDEAEEAPTKKVKV